MPKRRTTKPAGLTDQLKSQLEDVQKRVEGEVKSLRKRVEGEVKTLQKTARKNPTYVRTQKLFKSWDKELAELRSQALHALGLASKSDLDKLNRKLSTFSRRLNSLEKAA